MKTIKWQYNGVAPWHTIIAWCYDHLKKDDWETNMNETICFESEQAYILFILRFS